MFFIGGITQGTKELVYNAAAMICGRCGRYGRYQVFMTYMCLSFFFIPILKWGRKYYVKTSCCGTVYQLNEEVGKRIAAGEDVSIREEDLTLVSEGHDAWRRSRRTCCLTISRGSCRSFRRKNRSMCSPVTDIRIIFQR